MTSAAGPAPRPPNGQLRALPGVDFKRLPLTPAEGNVFMRVQGLVTEAQIAAAAGLQLATVQRAVDRLIELRAIEWFDAARAQRDEDTAAAGRLAFGGLGNLAGARVGPPTPGLYDPRELEEPVDLEPEKRRLICEAFYRLDALDYYELLGCHRLVDRKQVKSAYYAVAPDFHPDKFYGKNLGSYKAKIEAIFARVTLAHDVLSSKQKRGEYDDYLDMHERNRAAVVAAGSVDAAVQQARALADQAARAAIGGQSVPPPGGAPSADDAAAKALAERKRVLAMKLMGGKRPPSGSHHAVPAPGSQAQADARAAAEALRNRFEHAKHEATKRQVFHYIATGRDAVTKGDWAAAANAYRIAASLQPDDPNLQRDAQDVIQQSNRYLADNFMKQGEYEVSQERFSEAAISFGKAANGRPDDARCFDRAAFATFRAGNNPRRAVEYARRAVDLAPQNAMYRITLAYSFVAAGLNASVEAELARAVEVAPNDERVKHQLELVRDYMRQMQSHAGQSS
jgi:curved DNA-binding protein CbpA